MAKTYTRTGYSAAPTISLSLAPGGSLKPNTTYYYRAMTANNYRGYYIDYASALSNTASITTDTTNLSVVITLTHATGNPEYFYIWVSEGVDPGVGYWADKDSTTVYQLGTASAEVRATSGSTKGTTYTDDGTRLNNYMSIGHSSNYGMYLPHENAMDSIAVSGGTETDPVTLEDIYLYAAANGWPLEQTIDRVDYGRPGAGDTEAVARTGVSGHGRPTYILNAKSLYYGDYFSIKDCNVISFMGRFYQSSATAHITIGDYDENHDLSYNGVDWTTFVHSGQAGDMRFYNPKIYDSKFRSRKMAASKATPYLSNFALEAGSYNGYFVIIDSVVGSEYNRGMSINVSTTSSSNNIIKRVKHYDNAWETNTYGFGFEEINDWKFYIREKGPWLRLLNTYAFDFDIRNPEFRRINGSLLFVSPDTGGTSYTRVNLINPVTGSEDDWNYIYWYVTAPPTSDNAFINRAYTLIVRVVDEYGDGVEGATVTLVDGSSTTVFSESTDNNGLISEQKVIHTTYKNSSTLTTSHYQTSGRTTYNGPWVLTVSKDGYETYNEEMIINSAVNKSVALLTAKKIRVATDGSLLFAIGAEKGSRAKQQKI